MWIALLNQSLILYQDPDTDPMQSFTLVDAMVHHSTDAPGFRSRPSFCHLKDEFTIIVEMSDPVNASNDSETISLCFSDKDDMVSEGSFCLSFFMVSFHFTPSFLYYPGLS